jgi:uncharacterized protein (DUF2141 family)
MTAGKKALAFLLGVLALSPTAAQAMDCAGAPSNARLVITVEGVHESKGLMTATLYGADPSAFLVKGGALKVWRTAARAPTTTMCIWLPALGVYGVAVYHDANSNMKFDVGPLGPTEAFGFSNNPRILFSKPSFESVRFTAHAGDNTLPIRLRYP